MSRLRPANRPAYVLPTLVALVGVALILAGCAAGAARGGQSGMGSQQPSSSTGAPSPSSGTSSSSAPSPSGTGTSSRGGFGHRREPGRPVGGQYPAARVRGPHPHLPGARSFLILRQCERSPGHRLPRIRQQRGGTSSSHPHVHRLRPERVHRGLSRWYPAGVERRPGRHHRRRSYRGRRRLHPGPHQAARVGVQDRSAAASTRPACPTAVSCATGWPATCLI